MFFLDLPVQRPPPGPFSYHDLEWVAQQDKQPRISKENATPVLQTYHFARFPWDRLEDFFRGEGSRGVCTFFKYKTVGKQDPAARLAHLNTEKNPRKDSVLEVYFRHCNHGPENHAEFGDVLADKQEGQRRSKRQRGDWLGAWVVRCRTCKINVLKFCHLLCMILSRSV